MENEFLEEIKVAQFWRSVIGEYDYVNYDPNDLFRWYKALETRGPFEIRAYLNERAGKYPMQRLHGLVSKPPHPPMNVVMLWLESHELKTRTAPAWLGLAAFLTLFFLLGMGFVGCQNLHDPNTLVARPGQTQPQLLQPSPANAPPPTATFPAQVQQQPSHGPGAPTSTPIPPAQP